MPDIFGVPLDWRFAVVCMAALFGGFIRGFVGFGAALVIVPSIAVTFEPRIAVVAMTVLSIPALIQLLPQAIRNSEPPIVLPISIALLLAAPFGTWLLVITDPSVMKIVISGLVISMAAMLARGWRLEREVSTPILVGAGIASGLVHGVSSMGGPPVVAVALSRPGTPQMQRGNVLAVMTAVSVSAVLPQWYFGLYTVKALIIGLIILPIYGAAIMLGSRFFARGGDRYFKRAALGVLGLVGVAALVASVRDYLIN